LILETRLLVFFVIELFIRIELALDDWLALVARLLVLTELCEQLVIETLGR